MFQNSVYDINNNKGNLNLDFNQNINMLIKKESKSTDVVEKTDLTTNPTNNNFNIKSATNANNISPITNITNIERNVNINMKENTNNNNFSEFEESVKEQSFIKSPHKTFKRFEDEPNILKVRKFDYINDIYDNDNKKTLCNKVDKKKISYIYLHLFSSF